MASVGIKDLLEAGVHFGHQTKRWNPKMRPFIFDDRNGIYILDLTQTTQQLQVACDYLRKLVLGGEQVLFVGTKRQAQDAVIAAAERTGMHQVTQRWLGGTLTNSATIRSSVRRLRQLERMETEGKMDELPKKQVAKLRREYAKLHRNLGGIADMEKAPGALFVIDIKREEIAVREARRLGIPVVAIVDTNCDPDLADYVIAGNDDAIRAIRVVLDAVADSIEEAVNIRRSREDAAGRDSESAPLPPEHRPQPRPAAPSTRPAGAGAAKRQDHHVATETVISASPDEPGPAQTEQEADARTESEAPAPEKKVAEESPVVPPPPPGQPGR